MDTSSNPTPQPPIQSVIPSQPQPNPKGDINAITLRSGTQLKENGAKDSNPITITQEEERIDIEEVVEKETPQVIVEDETQPTKETPKTKRTLEEEIAQPLPFPTLAKKARKRIELDPKMDRILELETIPLGSSISALMGALPEKCDDPGPCMVTCTVNGVQFVDCMCDLGACVSIMPLSVYRVLKLPPLKRSTARFVLADKSIITVMGVVEDVLVNIKGLVFPIDFYVLEMPSSETERASSILLGRPFLRTSRFKLDAYSGTYSFEIDGRECNMSLGGARIERKLQLAELECLRLEAYDNSRLYKKQMKAIHDKNIRRKEFRPGDLVLLYNSRLRLLPGKLRSRWDGPYQVEKVEPYGVYHLRHPSSPDIFKVNGHRLKLYHGEQRKNSKKFEVFLLRDASLEQEL
ncbi:uncharacterized protein LOC107636460 [Arachis ipaensis]|uniref:uncharacterized protein LOC107636460 n=1 Tax=Arachis ipaensis TaxID=130454 RepID=UPI000A2B425A|nr:uncharacterized protein LOC107636460 [Arachis ipaensis]